MHACPSQLHSVHLCYHLHSTFETNSPGDDQRKSHCMAQYQKNTILTNFNSQDPHTLANYSKKVSKSSKLKHCTCGSPNLKCRCHLIIKSNVLVRGTVNNRLELCKLSWGPFSHWGQLQYYTGTDLFVTQILGWRCDRHPVTLSLTDSMLWVLFCVLILPKK